MLWGTVSKALLNSRYMAIIERNKVSQAGPAVDEAMLVILYHLPLIHVL